MENRNRSFGFQGGRFDSVLYEAASQKALDAVPLLEALETSRNMACGVVSLLGILKAHGVPECRTHGTTLVEPMQTDELLSFCIESMSLLNEKIERLADRLALQYERTARETDEAEED